MRKIFFLILAFFAVLGVSAQENILVEYFRYDFDSSKYDLRKSILREYEMGVSPDLDYSSFNHHPLSINDIMRSFSWDDVDYIFENVKTITETYFENGGTYKYFRDFFNEGEKKILRNAQDIKIDFSNGQLLRGYFLSDSIVFLFEKDKSRYSSLVSPEDYSDSICELVEYFEYSNGWELTSEYIECDSIIEDTLYGHRFTLGVDSILFKKRVDDNGFVTYYYSKEFLSSTKVVDEFEITRSESSNIITSIKKNYKNGSFVSQDTTFIDVDNKETCSKSFCIEYDVEGNISEYYIYIDGWSKEPFIRRFYENYSLGIQLDTISNIETVVDSMVMHRNYIVTSNNEETNNQVSSIFPNPSTVIVNIQVENNMPFTAEVFDIQGRDIRKEKGIGELQLSNLEKGSYIIKVISSQGVSTQRIEVVE